ncbi:MAG: hypothetical protein H6Q17_2596 [Bacteroidetes bacterium]|nr:hypothetical protein [Bacteroidota bacterium]
MHLEYAGAFGNIFVVNVVKALLGGGRFSSVLRFYVASELRVVDTVLRATLGQVVFFSIFSCF